MLSISKQMPGRYAVLSDGRAKTVEGFNDLIHFLEKELDDTFTSELVVERDRLSGQLTRIQEIIEE